MIDKHDIDEFVKRMEEAYHPSQSYAGKARDILSKMLAPDFPVDQAPRIFALAEDMYRSHAKTRANIDAAKKDAKEIASNIGRIADGVRIITDAYASSVEMIVRAGEEVQHAGEELYDAAQEQHEASVDLLGAAIRLQDAAEKVKEMKREEGALFAPPKRKEKN